MEFRAGGFSQATGGSSIDWHVGQRLRLRRTLLGISQQSLAESLGVTFQQIQKYEKGSNRVSAGRLYELAGRLGVPVAFFFEDFRPDGLGKIAADPAGESIETALMRTETLELVRNFWRIRNPQGRAELLRTIEMLAELTNTQQAAE